MGYVTNRVWGISGMKPSDLETWLNQQAQQGYKYSAVLVDPMNSSQGAAIVESIPQKEYKVLGGTYIEADINSLAQVGYCLIDVFNIDNVFYYVLERDVGNTTQTKEYKLMDYRPSDIDTYASQGYSIFKCDFSSPYSVLVMERDV